MRKAVIGAAATAVGITVATVIGATVASASGASAAGTERFHVLSTRQNGAAMVIAQGPIHARGKDRVVSGTKDKFVFPNGSITVVHHKVGKDAQRFDKITCYGVFREHGVYTVTRGTGAYKGAKGTGKYLVIGKFVGCAKAPQLFYQDIEASGPLSS